jgi:hypothetical protein
MHRLALALALAAVVTAPARAASPKPPDPAAELARQKDCVRAAVKELSKVTFTRKDVEKLLAEWRGFEALDEDEKEEGDTECFAVGKILRDPKYVAWAKGRGLDPRGFLLASARISMTFVKHRAPARVAQGRAQFEAQRTELRARCASMGPNACAELEKGFAQAEAVMKEAEAFMALFPSPTAAEAKLLDEYGDRLEAEMEGGDGDHLGAPEDEPGDEPDDEQPPPGEKR